uniref:Hsp20-like chaperone n=1 Tax=Tetraselmis sp. GSL018 TaxID=582737 RepID=A0A061RCP2_9CHLO|mmetsp:Transcript_25557/g.60791  ORF Transcript_25557/g.60791 Transcript_25557/m.60791 type:complete len:175 (+) Transcript_25557:138-662(+)
MTKLTPEIYWAQRSDRVFITLDVQDCASPSIKLDNDEAADTGRLEFSGNGSGGKDFELSLNLHKAINVDESKIAVRPRKIEIVAMKSVKEDNWWPFLTKEKTRDPHIKVDWNKWVDEDEEDEADKDGGFDLSAMQNFANFGGGDMGMDDLDDAGDDEDSDDENLPDLESAPKEE